jgi:hemerythrin-like domain-containing protein
MRRDPFEMLLRCHRRLEETLAALATPTRQTLDEALHFFDRALARHEADEEQSLFLRLAAVPSLAPLLDRLTVQHRDGAALIDELRALVAAAKPSESRLAQVIKALGEAYGAHILVEERELFPAARAVLDDAAIAAMSAEMESRRGR